MWRPHSVSGEALMLTFQAGSREAFEHLYARYRGPLYGCFRRRLNEQMEAERKNMANQVSYAAINPTITEDYKAQLQVVPSSTSTRIGNAAVEGYRNVVDEGLNIAMFLLTTVPALLLWGMVRFFPARFAWKKLRSLRSN